MHGIKAMAFDIQGTVVDFYEPLVRAGAALNAAKGLAIDCGVELYSTFEHRAEATL